MIHASYGNMLSKTGRGSSRQSKVTGGILTGFIMDYYPAGSLATLLKGGALSIGDAQRIGLQLLSGARAIHACDTAHLDIKPSNVLFSATGSVAIADFGLARTVDATGITPIIDRMYAGATPPEYFATGRGTILSDIYQIGLTLYRAVNGDRHYNEQWTKADKRGIDAKWLIRDGKLPDRASYLPCVPQALRAIINRAVDPDSAKRFPSATAFASALGTIKPRYDWQPDIDADGCGRYRGESEDRVPVVCKVEKNGRAFSVRFFTDGAKRMKTRTPDWKSGLTRAQAQQHVQKIIRTLERT